MDSMMAYYSRLHTHRESELLMAAIELKVFGGLATVKTSLDLAEELGYNARNLELF